jgi:hypothetical protein
MGARFVAFNVFWAVMIRSSTPPGMTGIEASEVGIGRVATRSRMVAVTTRKKGNEQYMSDK